MAMISKEDQEFLKNHFAKELQSEVKIVYFTQKESPLAVPGQQCQYCRETKDILDELASLSDKINVEVLDLLADKARAEELGVDKIPGLVLQGQGKGTVRYFGIPSGYEFSTLIEDVVEISKPTTGLSDKTKAVLQKIDKDLHIQVFVTPT